MNNPSSYDSYGTSGYSGDVDALPSARGGRDAPSGEPTAGDIVAVASELVETQLRTRPIPTLLAALAAGWLLGRILR